MLPRFLKRKPRQQKIHLQPGQSVVVGGVTFSCPSNRQLDIGLKPGQRVNIRI